MLFLLFFALALAEPCVYTQNYWRTQASALQMCGSRWDALLRFDAPLLVDAQQQVWFDAFQQCAAASFNLARLGVAAGEQATLVALLLGQLERGCASPTNWSLQWRYDASFTAQLQQVRALNRGESVYPACGDEFAPPPFSFANRSDLFMVVLPNNETVPAGSAYFGESLANALQIKGLMIAFITLSLMLSVIVALMWFMLVRKRRISYHCCEPRSEEEHAYALQDDTPGLDDEIELSDMEPPLDSKKETF